MENLIGLVFTVFEILIIARVLLSWFPVLNETFRPIAEFVYDVTEPILAPIRRIIPSVGAGGVGLDLSPLVAILLLEVGKNAVPSLLYAVL